MAQNDQEIAETFVLVGVSAGWQGQEPASIEDVRNPTLDLEAGKRYRVTWENGDGKSHNFAIFTSDGDLVVFSPFIHDEGETQTVEFVATESMVDYYCEVHYLGMRGSLNVSGTTNQTAEPVNAGYFADGPTIGLKKVVDGGLSWPVAMGAPDEEQNRRFIADQPGKVYVHDANGLRSKPFLDVQEKLYHETPLHPETGLLGIAFHPNFAENGLFYTRESRPKEQFPQSAYPKPRSKYHHMSTVTQYKANEDRTVADPESSTFILTMPSPQSNHNSGDLDFGPDGLLYIPIGDGGFGGDQQQMFGHAKYGNAQDVTTNLLGSVLRIDVDGQSTVRGERKPYTIPDDNPLVGREGLDEHYAWGFRNPWGMSLDSQGRLFLGDVGRSLYEEVNLVQNGGNYGWKIREGTHCFNPVDHAAPPEVCATENHRGETLLPPIIEYPHSYQGKPVGQSVVGGHVYEGDALPQLQGKYVFGDWSYSPVVGSSALMVATEPKGGQGQGSTGSAGNATATNESGSGPAGNATAANESGNGPAGNATTVNTTSPTRGTQNRGQNPNTWSVAQLGIAGIDGNRPNFFLSAFGTDEEGLYILTSPSFRRDKKNGAVYKIVPPEQGTL